MKTSLLLALWTVAAASRGHLEAIHTPNALAAPSSRPVVIAIVDDGLRLDHHDLRDLIWSRPTEIAGNGVDDDGNGHVDDVHGWDVADNDADVRPPAHRADEYNHGTHVAGIIADIAHRAFGDAAPRAVRLLGVKAVADDAARTYVEAGFEGIDYAIRAGADVIVCAWGLAHISPHQRDILDRAAARGVVIVASAGNFGIDREHFPAAHPTVLAIAALDRNGRKHPRSNYGPFIDLAAPGEAIEAAIPTHERARGPHDGTSPAAAMVGAAAALIRYRRPHWTPPMVAAALSNTAANLDPQNPTYAANLGAGLLDIAAAIETPLWQHQVMWRGPQGAIPLLAKRHKPAGFAIAPFGELHGLRLRLSSVEGTPGSATLAVYAGKTPRAQPVWQGRLVDLPREIFVAGNRAYVRFDPVEEHASFRALLTYRAESLAVSTRYCRGTVKLSQPGVLEDGSGAAQYTPATDCKWLITAPRGQVVQFEFEAFDTEPRTDMVYFFNGAGAHEPIMAIYSGPDIPPPLTTWRNRVLVWFVTNEKQQGQGWRARYRFRPAPPPKP